MIHINHNEIMPISQEEQRAKDLGSKKKKKKNPNAVFLKMWSPD